MFHSFSGSSIRTVSIIFLLVYSMDYTPYKQCELYIYRSHDYYNGDVLNQKMFIFESNQFWSMNRSLFPLLSAYTFDVGVGVAKMLWSDLCAL